MNFNYADFTETLRRYDIKKIKNGYNVMPDGEAGYFISTPSAGLWSTEEKSEIVLVLDMLDNLSL